MVANSLFITGTDVDSGSRNWQKGTDKIATGKETDGNTSRVKSHTHTVETRLKKYGQRKQGKSLYTKKIVCNVHGGLARSSSSCLCGYIQVTEKPTKSDGTAVGGKTDL